MARKIKKKPFHPYEDSILRTLNKSQRNLTPTKIARIIGIHPITAKKRIVELERRGFIKCKKGGEKKLLCKINRKKFK